MNPLLKADLHCHSFYSDGFLSPDALLSKAVAAGVKILALTDHDTVAGVASLCEAARHQDITVIRGIELSVRWKTQDIHIVGLNIDDTHPALTQLIQLQNERRMTRGREMAALLQDVGVHDAYEKASAIAGHDRIGRPHLAQVLMNEGLVKDMQSAFTRYLGRGKRAHVPTRWASVEEAVSIITEAGGMAVIAHPLKYKLTRSKLNKLIELFKSAGGNGIEVVSGETNVSQATEMAGLCLRFDLLASTGSDYHNDSYSRIRLGGQLPLPLNCKPIWEEWLIQ